MEPEVTIGLIERVLGLLRQLGDMGVAVNLPVMILTCVAMEVLKAIDKRAWVRRRKAPRGKRPGDSGYLVPVYPLLAVLIGGALGLLWRVLADGQTVGAAVASGCVSGALMALAYKGYTTWRNFRRLAAKARDGGGG